MKNKWYLLQATIFTVILIALLIQYNGVQVLSDFLVRAGLVPYLLVLWMVTLLFTGKFDELTLRNESSEC